MVVDDIGPADYLSWTPDELCDVVRLVGRMNAKLSGATPIVEGRAPDAAIMCDERALVVLKSSEPYDASSRQRGAATLEALAAIAARRDDYVRLVRATPRLFCHCQASARNLRRVTTAAARVCLGDWSYWGVASVGVELGALLTAASREAATPWESRYRDIVDAYCDGLSSDGMRAERDAIAAGGLAGLAIWLLEEAWRVCRIVSDRKWSRDSIGTLVVSERLTRMYDLIERHGVHVIEAAEW
jgi:hypothetical protein